MHEVSQISFHSHLYVFVNSARDPSSCLAIFMVLLVLFSRCLSVDVFYIVVPYYLQMTR